jgi:hypothetical protein
MSNGFHAWGLKASIPLLRANFHKLDYTRYLTAFSAGSIRLKKPLGGPKGLIGPHAMGRRKDESRSW